ncbi:MAG TPA: hypothetical protein VGR49_03855 [Actinomycetota bacterium]|nr:hypothetical protein [Actinomycetota bacterium]
MRRWIVAIVGLGVLAGLFVLLRPKSEPQPGGSPTRAGTPATPSQTASPSPTTGADVFEIEVEVEESRVQLEVEGQERPEQSRVPVEPGTRVEIEVKADTTDEVHVHGYDLMADVSPQRKARVRFRADVAGIFEVELEDAGLLLFRLEVTP